MIKYMAAEKVFQKRVFDIRKRELKYQKRQFTVETLWSAIWCFQIRSQSQACMKLTKGRV